MVCDAWISFVTLYIALGSSTTTNLKSFSTRVTVAQILSGTGLPLVLHPIQLGNAPLILLSKSCLSRPGSSGRVHQAYPQPRNPARPQSRTLPYCPFLSSPNHQPPVENWEKLQWRWLVSAGAPASCVHADFSPSRCHTRPRRGVWHLLQNQVGLKSPQRHAASGISGQHAVLHPAYFGLLEADGMNPPHLKS
jgi:hypothetical protein